MPGPLRRLAKNPDGRVGLAIVASFALFATVLGFALPAPNESDFSLPDMPDGGPPTASAAHWLGVDSLFRDELSRLVAGARVSLGIAALASAIATAVGVAVGIAAASARRDASWLDGILMRVIDVLLAFPFLLLVTAIGVLVGRTDIPTMILVLGLTGFPGLARIVRARALVVLELDFVAAAHALGSSRLRVAWRHVLPNVMPIAIALFTSLVGSMILAEAVLGYLTVGLAPPDASWGRMLHEAEGLIVQRPLLVASPAACILLASLGFHRLGEGLAQLGAGAPKTTIRRLPFPLDIALVGAGLALLLALPQAELRAPFEPEPEGAPRRGGVLRLATAYSIHSIDPALAADEGATIATRLIFGRLVDLDDRGQFVPGLSTALAWDDEGRTLRVTLRDGVELQDGSRFTAAIAKRSIERALAHDVPSPGAHNYAGVVGFRAYREGAAPSLAGVTAEGDLTLVIRLEEPNGVLPSLLALPFVAPVCPSTPMSVQATRDLELCGAGPFQLQSFDPEQGLVLKRNPRYFEHDLPYLDGIQLLFNVRAQAQRHRFEKGELDFVRELTSSDAALFRADERYRRQMHLVENMRTSAIYMNTEKPPFDNRALRRAVSFAIDPSVLTRLRPDVVESDRIVPRGVPGRPDGVRGRVHDPARALAAMAEAGFPYDPVTKRGGYPEEIDYITVPDSFEQAAAEIYQQQLARVGIRIRLRLLTNAAYAAETQRRGRTVMGWAGWQADYPDPVTFFDPNLVSTSLADVTQNYSAFQNAELDARIADARRETDPKRRELLLREAEQIVIDEAPWVPTTSPRSVEMHAPWLHGYKADAVSSMDFTRTYLTRSFAGDDIDALALGARESPSRSQPHSVLARLR